MTAKSTNGQNTFLSYYYYTFLDFLTKSNNTNQQRHDISIHIFSLKL